MNYPNAKQKTALCFLALGIISLFFIFVYKTTGIYFETNDERIISEILSGALSAKPDAHVAHINYLLTLPIAGLYSLTKQVPWYGLCLILLQGLAYFLVFISIYFKCRRKRDILVSTALFIIILFSNISLLGKIQFTSTAMLMAAAGYLCLLIEDISAPARSQIRSYIFFFLLELLAFFLRKESMLLIIPLGIAVFGGTCLINTSLPLQKRIRPLIITVSMLVSIFFISFLGNTIGYHSPEWKEYLKTSHARAELFDYLGTPSYEEVQPILESYGVTAASYNAYRDLTMLDENINSDCLDAIVKYQASKVSRYENLETLPLLFYQLCLETYYWKINQVTALSFLLLFFYLILSNNKKLLLPILGFGLAECIIWFYLLMHKRYPLRVILPIFICSTAFSLGLFFRHYKPLPRLKKFLLGGAFILFTYVSLFSFQKQYSYLSDNNHANQAEMDVLIEVHEYCLQRKEFNFLLDPFVPMFSFGSALETSYYSEDKNYIISGCWYSYAPPMVSYTQTKFLADSNKLRLIFPENIPDMHLFPFNIWRNTIIVT